VVTEFRTCYITRGGWSQVLLRGVRRGSKVGSFCVRLVYNA